MQYTHTQTHTYLYIYINMFISHSPSLVFPFLLLLGWSSRDNGRLIITMKLSWFSAPLGAVGRAAAASEIDPSASPLIIQKHKFSWAWNLLVSSQMTVGSCATCLHMYVLVDVWEWESEIVKMQNEERAHCQHLCVYKNVGACLSRLMCVCVLFLTVLVLFLFSQPLLNP